ncbi:MAG: ATP-binding cassette domain-containing protein [Gammaproteobacteria bacterium]|nr:ATP-binding cassette domain-containing protein [Gammaproteobacteria bacterium]
MSSALSITNLSKHYGSHKILSDINLEITEGEFFGLVGINGAGKTTLIKCLLDFTEVDSGSIAIFGKQHTANQSRRNLSFLPEKFVPPYYLSAKDFLVYMHELHGSDYDQEKVDELLRTLDFDPVNIDKSVGQLSKGMSQKIGLAACLLSGKELLLLDEPMSGLDPRARAYLKKYLLERKEEGKTLFFSTHMLNDVEALCDKVAILHGGEIRFAGSPAQCCRDYKTNDFEQAYLACVGD